MIYIKQNNLIIIFVLVLVIGVAAAFFGGMQYQKSQERAQFPGQMNQNGQAGQQRLRNGAGGGIVNGQVLNVDAKTMTVKLPDGSSKIVLLSDKTTISQATASAVTDIKLGINVAAFGTTNSDGSVTAQNIQINPVQRGPGNNQ